MHCGRLQPKQMSFQWLPEMFVVRALSQYDDKVFHTRGPAAGWPVAARSWISDARYFTVCTTQVSLNSVCWWTENHRNFCRGKRCTVEARWFSCPAGQPTVLKYWWERTALISNLIINLPPTSSFPVTMALQQRYIRKHQSSLQANLKCNFGLKKLVPYGTDSRLFTTDVPVKFKVTWLRK